MTLLEFVLETNFSFCDIDKNCGGVVDYCYHYYQYDELETNCSFEMRFEFIFFGFSPLNYIHDPPCFNNSYSIDR